MPCQIHLERTAKIEKFIIHKNQFLFDEFVAKTMLVKNS